MLEAIREMVSYESLGYAFIKELKRTFTPEMVNNINVSSYDEALVRSNEVVRVILEVLDRVGLNMMNVEPGHGPGHLVRDRVNGLMALSKETSAIDPRDVFVGMIAGTLHDFGCTLVRRYAEPGRVVRHGEIGAILFNAVASKIAGLLSKDEVVVIAHAIAGHAHSSSSQKVKCQDGIWRETFLYEDTKTCGEETKPIYAMWLPRWIDRLDLNGPCIVGRHFLTMVEYHIDNWSGEVDFVKSISPLVLRENPTKPLSVAEHLKRCADTQTNESPYGKHDIGFMVTLRDDERQQLYRILARLKEKREFSAGEENTALGAWTMFLYTNIEPSKRGRETAEKLREMFKSLPDEVRFAWLGVYCQTMAEYMRWAQSRMEFLDSCPEHWVSLPPIRDDVRDIIRPNERWVKLLKEVQPVT